MTDDQGADEAVGSTSGTRGERPRRRHRRTVLLVIALTQLLIAGATAGAVVLGYQHIDGNIADGEQINHHVEKVLPDDHEDEVDEPLNILVMGSDSRDGEGNGIDGETGSGERSDTTILLHVSANRRHAYGVSLPRDAIVDRPRCELENGETVPRAEGVMFNEAFALGGAQCTVQMVEALTGIYIDHFVVLDFNGFKDMVDAVDGVEVCIPKEVSDPEHNIYFDSGVQTLTGQDALNYVRERSVLSVTGDIGRMKRQQAFIASMVNKVMSAGTLSQPRRVFGFLDAVTSSIEVDDDLDSVRALADLAMEVRDTGLTNIKFITVPIAEYPEDPNRLIWTDAADGLWERIVQDQQLGKDFSEGSIVADEGVGSTDSPTTEPTPDGEPSDGPSNEPSDDEAEAEARLAAGLCA